MIKQTLAALAIIAVSATAMTGMSGTAEAGGKRHFKFHNLHFKHRYVHVPKYHGGGCFHLKKKAKILKYKGQFRAAKLYYKKYKLCKIRSAY